MLRDLAERIRREREALAGKMLKALSEQVPACAGLPRPARQELLESLGSLALLVARLLESDGEAREDVLEYARGVGGTRFFKDLTFDDLVRAHYAGEGVVWGELTGGLAEEGCPPEGWTRLLEIKADLDSDLVSALSSSYAEGRDRDIDRRLRELTAMIEVGKTIASTIQLDQVFRQILQVSVSLMQVSKGAVYLLDEGSGELRLEAAQGLARPWVKGMAAGREGLLLHRAMGAGKMMSASDEELEGLRLPVLAGGRRPRSLVSCPVYLGDDPIGGIELYDQRPRAYQELDLMLLSIFASQAGVAIQNARLFALERRRREQALISKEMAEDIARSINLYQAQGIVVHNLASIAAVDRCTLFRYLPDTGEIEFVRGFGLKESERKMLKGFRMQASRIDEATRAAVEDREIQVVNDAASDPRSNSRFARDFNVRSCLLVPLVFHDRVTGLVYLDHTRRRHFFDRNEVEMVRAAASQAAQAVEQVKMRDSIHRKEMALRQAQVDREVFKERERSEAIINANPDAIMMIDRDLRVVSFNPAAEKLTGWRAGEAVGRSCCEIFQGRRPDAGECRKGDCPIARAMRGDASPLEEMLYERPDGSRLWVGGSFAVLRNPKRRIESVVAVLRDISEQKRLAHMALVEKELEIARQTQSALLPPGSLDHARVKIDCRQEQARLVGGDWFDYWIEGGRLVLVIGDAAGSGMPAALMATLAMSTIRSEAHRSEDIAEIIRRVNLSILPNRMEDNFLTIFYSEIDLEDLTMRYLNAGHHDPLLVRARRGSQFLTSRERLILGAFDHFDLGVEEVRLKEGDRLILYTDGLIESRNPQRAPFGLNRLVRYVNANGGRERAELIDGLYARLRDFTAKPFEDDITVLVCDLS